MPENVTTIRNDQNILTVHEVAEYLRMSEANACRLANDWCHLVVSIGKAWRFRKDLLHDWLSQCTESSIGSDGK